jgi:hypothetical protein
MSNKMLHVHLDDEEGGWIEMLYGLNVRIANIPMGGRWNLDDVVKADLRSLAANPDRPLKGRLIEQDCAAHSPS